MLLSFPFFYDPLFLDHTEERGRRSEATLFLTKCKWRDEEMNLHILDASSKPLLILDACYFNSMSKELGTFS